jgi:parallel beta-helix repeat protein
MVSVLLFVGTFTCAFDVRPANAQAETIYINSDGSVIPSSAPISSLGNVTYAFTGNISYPVYNGIVVERGSILVDGNGYTIQGNQSGTGISVTTIDNVKIRNINVESFQTGISIGGFSNNNTISGNNATANSDYGIYLGASSSNFVTGNNATANGYGIYLSGSYDNVITGNNANANSNGGISLYPADENIISANNASGNAYGIELWASSNNTISGNNATANNYGIYVNLLYSRRNIFPSSNNNIVANILADNKVALDFGGTSNNTVYHNSFVGNSAQVGIDDISLNNTWNDAYPSGGNFWSNYNGTDMYCGSYQNESSSDGVSDTPYVIDRLYTGNIDHYPLMNPWTYPDIAATNLTISKTIFGQGYPALVNVTFKNHGNKAEAFNATVYANSTIIHSEQIVLAMTNSTLNFEWDPTGFTYGNYTISAHAWPVPYETNTANDCIGCLITVSIPGDINGDFKVGLQDLVILAQAYGSRVGDAKYDPNVDIDSTGAVGLLDLYIMALHYGQHYP